MSKIRPLISLANTEVNALMPIAYVRKKKAVQLCWALTLFARPRPDLSSGLYSWFRMLPAHNITSISAFSSHVVCASHQTSSNVPAKRSKFAIIWRRNFHRSLPSVMQRTLTRKIASKHTTDSRVRRRNTTATLTGTEKEIYVFWSESLSTC